MKLKLAHIKLMNQNENLDELKLWGKIEGLQKNYYIMMGLKYVGSYEFPHKTFYWAYFKCYSDLKTSNSKKCQNFFFNMNHFVQNSMAISQEMLTKFFKI